MDDKSIDRNFLSINQLAEYLDVTRMTISRLQKQKGFPKPVLILTQKKWRKSEIDAYLESTRQSSVESTSTSDKV